MTEPSRDQQLQDAVQREVERKRRAHAERDTILAHTIFLGTLALLFVLPVIGLAYLGVWLDGLSAQYSARWTVSLILLGLCLGAINVYLYVRENP